MQWSEGIQEFGFDCKVRKLSPKTIDNYSKQLRYFQRYLQSEFELVEIEKVKAYVIAWTNYLSEPCCHEIMISPNSKARICEYLAAWADWDGYEPPSNFEFCGRQKAGE